MSIRGVTTGQLDASEVGLILGPEIPRAPTTRLSDVACRVMDVVVAAVVLLVLTPILVVIALAVRLDSKGPALFRQRRLGRDLDPFTVVKFRTMRIDAEHEVHREFVLKLIAGEVPEQSGDGPRYKLNEDSRVTRLGNTLRRTSLDELPQLLNVIRGDMSLVGPRPPIPYEVEHYPSHWFGRFAVRPGVTGLWQVSGRSELTLEQMIQLDLEYVRRKSPWLNIWILLRTLPVVIGRRGAS